MPTTTVMRVTDCKRKDKAQSWLWFRVYVVAYDLFANCGGRNTSSFRLPLCYDIGIGIGIGELH